MHCTKWLGALCAIGLLLFQAGPARAAPESGFWWNPNESGRGFAIEFQGNKVFMGAFLYEPNGRSTWYASAGTTQADGSYQGTLQAYGNGQTLSGAYKTNAVTNPNAGSIALQFSDATHGTLTWPGGTIAIERFVFGSSPRGFKPETGLWWNAAETGRGFLIEVQGTNLWLGGYMYDDAGNPVWYSASGPMISTTLFQGHWDQYSGGQTMTGVYRSPASPPASAGNVTLQFTGTTTATLTLPDARQIRLTRFYFGPAPTGNAASDAIFQAPADPVNVGLATDTTSAVTETVTVAGGTLNASDVHGNKYTLTIPADALEYDMVVTMTPITGMSGASFASGLVAGVKLEPDALSLRQDAILTIVPARDVPVANQTLFGSRDGNDMHMAIPGPDFAQIQVRIPHFSGWGLIFMTAEERRTALILKRAADYEARFINVLGAYFGWQRLRQVLGADAEDKTPPPSGVPTLDEVAAVIASYYDLVIRPRLRVASTSCANALLALDTLSGFERLLALLAGSGLPESAYSEGIAQVNQAFKDIKSPCEFYGTGKMSASDVTATTTTHWKAAEVSGKVYTYRPRGSARADFTTPLKSCKVSREVGDVTPDSGYLIVDYSTEPATYRGMGLASWTMHISCPISKTETAFPVKAIYLGGDSEAKGVVNPNGSATVAGGLTVVWRLETCKTTVWPFSCSFPVIQ